MEYQIETPALNATKILHLAELTIENSKSRHQLLPATFQSFVTQEKASELIISLFYTAGTMPTLKTSASYEHNTCSYINMLREDLALLLLMQLTTHPRQSSTRLLQGDAATKSHATKKLHLQVGFKFFCTSSPHTLRLFYCIVFGKMFYFIK